jgi:CRISPR-associated protein Csm1
MSSIEDRYKLMLVAYLHDIGKVYQRAEYLRTHRFARKHDEISAEKIRELLGKEYEEIFRKEEWRAADEFTAELERKEDEEGTIGTAAEAPLLSPLNEVNEGFKKYHSVQTLDIRKEPKLYFLHDKEGEASKNYQEVEAHLNELLGKLKNYPKGRALLETLNYIFKSTTLFVPAATYGVKPDTTLYGHSKLTAVLSSALSGGYGLIRINIKGIQRFVTNVVGESEASKRFRGRSLFLQLLQQALTDYITTKLGYSELNNIAPEPGEIILLIDKNDYDRAKGLIESVLNKLFEWSNYELQFELHAPKDVIGNAHDPGSFSNVYNALWEGPGWLIGFTKILSNVDVDRYGDSANRVFSIVDGSDECVRGGEVSIQLMNSLAPGTFEVGDKVSLMNLLSLVVGHASRNLKYVMEVIYRGDKPVDEPIVCYNRYNNFMVTNVFVEPLNTKLILISSDSDVNLDINTIKLLVKNADKADLIKVLKVNDPLNFIPSASSNDELLEKTVWGWFMLDMYHPVTEDGEFKDLDSMGNYIALGVVDADELGSIVRGLSRRPGVLESFSTILSFAINYVPIKVRDELKSKHDECGENIVVLYSGGDDVAVYGRWDCVIKFLAMVANHVNKITGLSLSGGVYVFRSKYPIYYAYREARSLESLAKKEGKDMKNMGIMKDTSGLVALSIAEPYLLGYTEKPVFALSITWDEAEKMLEIAHELVNSPKVPSSLLYRLYEIGAMIHDALSRGNKTLLARALVTYAYLYVRNEETMKELSKVMGSTSDLRIPDYPRTDNEETTVKALLKLRTLINMYSLLSRT